MPEKGRIMEKLKGSVSRENTGEFFGDKLPFGATKASAKEKWCKGKVE